MPQIDQTHLNENADKIKLARPALNAIASFVNKLLGYVTDDITSTEKAAMRTVLDVPVNASVVNITGDQTVNGKKSFTSRIEFAGNGWVGPGINQYANWTVGYGLTQNVTGHSNFVAGSYTLPFDSDARFCVAIGSDVAMSVQLSGCRYLTAVGYGAVMQVAGYLDKATFLGAMTGANAGNKSNITCVGYGSDITGNEQVQLGNSATTTYVYGTVQNRSDLRDKADVRDTVLGLDFIKALRPVDYKWDMREDYRPERPADLPADATDEERATHQQALEDWVEAYRHENIVRDGSKKRNRYHHGLIAQEVKETLDSLGIDFGGYQDHKVAGGSDVLSIGYDELIAPLIKAVQQLSEKVEILEQQLSTNG